MSAAPFVTASSKINFRSEEKLLLVVLAMYEMTGRPGTSVPVAVAARLPRQTVYA
jgi:hypothetical protein